jgi:glycosyltransferase involved in cell wall biosynthesis
MAKTVLLLTSHFPPVGGPATQRALNLVRHLPDMGWIPIVVTGSGVSGFFWAPNDAALDQQVPEELQVARVATPEVRRLRGRVERLFGLPGSFGRDFAERASAVAGEFRGQVDVLLCEFGFYALARSAVRLSRELGVPWVADLQDPWALDEMWLYPTGLHRKLDLRRMRNTLADASGVILNTPEAAERVRRAFPELDATRVSAVPSGFNPSDFADPVPPRQDGAFRIVHTGSLHTELGLRERQRGWLRRRLGGRPVPGVDVLTRSHVFLLEAVDRLTRQNPSLRSVVEVHFVGPMTEADQEVADSSPASHCHGFLSHADTLRMIRNADLLFLPMHDLPRGERAGLVPTKTYEYAASGRPILAAVPEGDARDFLRELGTAIVADPGDSVAMERAIAAEIARWRRSEPSPPPDSVLLASFEYREIARRVADVLDTVARKREPDSVSASGL